MPNHFTVHLDDSGHPDDQDAVVVAGWVSTAEQWLLLERAWKNILSEFNIKSGFHRTTFQAGQGEYAALSCPDKCRLLYKLNCQITTRTRFGFCSIVPMADYKEVNDIFYLEEGLGKPYALAGSTLAQRIENWKTRYTPDEAVAVVLEEGSKHKGDLEDVFIHHGFDRPIFRWKQDVVALQTADVLAWECFHAFEFDKVTRSFNRLLRVPFDHGVYSAKDLIEACEAGNIPRREAGKNVKVYFKRLPKKLRTRKILGSSSEHLVKGAERVYRSYPPIESPDDFRCE